MSLLGSKQLVARCHEMLKSHLSTVYHHFADPTVQEIMINGPTNIWVERNGRSEKLDITVTEQSLISAITIIANLNGKPTSMTLDCRLPGLRIAATLPPVSVHGPSMSIRRHASRSFTLDDYLDAGSFAAKQFIVMPEVADAQRPADIAEGGPALLEFFKWMMQNRVNFIISGSTSSGKTALLNALAAYIPESHRVITIEDTAELRITVPNYVSFEANPSYGIHIRDLVKHTLRYRPNRILVGEIRGAEAFDMLDAYNTGHPGSAVSFHSDTAEMALSRLENMVRMAPEAANWPLADLRRQIAATFRFVIHASNVAGHRGPIEIIELHGASQGNYKTETLFKKQFEFVPAERVSRSRPRSSISVSSSTSISKP